MTDDLLERADRAARIAVNRDLIGALASAVREARCERDEARARLSALRDAIGRRDLLRPPASKDQP